MLWILDLDGVVWIGNQAIEGSAKAIDDLHRRGDRVIFTTNNSFMTIEGYLAKLRGFSIQAAPEDIFTSALAAAQLASQDHLVATCAGPGVTQALEKLNIPSISLLDSLTQKDLLGAVKSHAIGSLIVGYHLEFGYSSLSAEIGVLASGARLIGTNSDPTYPTQSGLLAGTGALVASFSYGAGIEPIYAGKPCAPMVDLVKSNFILGSDAIVVGDRPSTDGLFARSLGARFGLVYSGVTPKSQSLKLLQSLSAAKSSGTSPSAGADNYLIEPDISADTLYDLVFQSGQAK